MDKFTVKYLYFIPLLILSALDSSATDSLSNSDSTIIDSPKTATAEISTDTSSRVADSTFIDSSLAESDSSYTVIQTDSSLADTGIADSLQLQPDKEIDTTSDQKTGKSLWEGIDTSYQFWNSPYFGFGLGWSLGRFELFDIWEGGLPSALTDFNLEPNLLTSEYEPSASDTDITTITYETQENPTSYTIYFPLMLSFTPVTDTLHRLSIESNFFFISKSLISSIQDDSLSNRVDISHSLNFLSLSLGANYSYILPMKYFSINGVEHTVVNLGFSVSPLAFTKTNTTVETESPPNGLFSHIKQVGTTPFSDVKAYGAGISWKIGMSSLRRLTPAAGIDMGVFYTGHWFGYFHDKGEQLKNGDISKTASNPTDYVSLLAHRLEIRLLLLRGKKPEAFTRP